MNTNRAKFHLREADYGRGFELRIAQVDADGQIVAEPAPLVWQKTEDSGAWSQPVAVLDKTSAQSLMDSLWEMGFRPERGQLSVGQVAATERHLADMRAIAFAKLDVAKP